MTPKAHTRSDCCSGASAAIPRPRSNGSTARPRQTTLRRERDLGILLRENGDIQGAHHWLSRAADRDGQARHALAELVESH